MKPKLFAERGQALILIAFAAIGLFAIVGLAIDGSAKYSDRRHAQNAADAAALAGSLALTSEDPAVSAAWVSYARDRADDNGYFGDLLHNQVWVYKCNTAKTDLSREAVWNDFGIDCGPYETKENYVQVVIKSQVNTYFARVIGIQTTRNIVNAVTYWEPRGKNYDGNLIVALNPNPCSGGGADGNIVIGTSGGGTGEINLMGGGAYVNSSDGSCGMNLTGCPKVTIDGELGSAGSGNIDLSTNTNCSTTLTVPTPTFNNDPYPFPPDMPKEPPECDPSNAGTFSSNSGTQITTMNPGRYNEFPPKSGGGITVYDHVVMSPGIYCVNDMVKVTDQHLVLTGHDVTIYIRNGYAFSLQGGSIQIDAPDTGDYAGYLIIVDSDFSGTPKNCTIDGNSANIFTGTIFAPYCNLTVNGTSDATSYSSQMIAYTVKLNGSAAVNLNYVEGENAKSDAKMGLMR